MLSVIPTVNSWVEEAASAVGGAAGCDGVKSASCMNGAILICLDSTSKVNDVVERDIVIHDGSPAG